MNAFKSVTDRRGKHWLVNWDGLGMVVRFYYAADTIHSSARVEKATDHIGLFHNVPIQNIVIDWKTVHQTVEQKTHSKVAEFLKQVKVDGQRVFNELADMRQRGRQLDQLNSQMFGQVAQSNSGAYNGMISRLNTEVEVMKTARDLSIDTLVIGAGVASGGVAWAALGTGSVMKGVAKYQDTANVGAAVLEGTGTFFVGAFDVGVFKTAFKGLSKGEKVIVYFTTKLPLSAAFSMSTSLVSGDSLKEAGMKFAFQEVSGKLLEVPGEMGLFKKLPFRIAARFRMLPAGTKMLVKGVTDLGKDRAADAFAKDTEHTEQKNSNAGDGHNHHSICASRGTGLRALKHVSPPVHGLPLDADQAYVSTQAIHSGI